MRGKINYRQRLELLHRVQEQCHEKFPRIPEDVLIFMASRISRNTRALIKGIICLQVYSMFTQKAVCIAEAKDILNGTLDYSFQDFFIAVFVSPVKNINSWFIIHSAMYAEWRTKSERRNQNSAEKASH